MSRFFNKRVTASFGRDGIFAIKLGAQGDTQFGDGEWQNIKVNVRQNVDLSVADPQGLIPAWASYKLHFTTSLGADPTIRFRMIDAASMGLLKFTLIDLKAEMANKAQAKAA